MRRAKERYERYVCIDPVTLADKERGQGKGGKGEREKESDKGSIKQVVDNLSSIFYLSINLSMRSRKNKELPLMPRVSARKTGWGGGGSETSVAGAGSCVHAAPVCTSRPDVRNRYDDGATGAQQLGVPMGALRNKMLTQNSGFWAYS